jgi:hypothetical protein
MGCPYGMQTPFQSGAAKYFFELLKAQPIREESRWFALSMD